MRYGRFPQYVPVGQRRSKADRKIREMKKRDPDIEPIVIEGRTLAHTWWGKAWNKNLEQYADYHNRIGRGRSYVRHGAVIDLKISPGHVIAQVIGSHSQPYSVEIKITPLPLKTWKGIITDCAGELQSMQELLAGRFPKTIGERFTSPEAGLFPSPKEITFDCSCPDWAYMCKHVAAVLYGVGARLDELPELIFTLRNVALDELISTTMQDATNQLLSRAGENRQSDQVEMGISELSEMFGIEMDEPTMKKPVKVPTRKKAKTGSKKQVPPKDIAAKKQAKGRAASGKKATSDAETIRLVICRSKKGIDFAKILKKTGLPEIKIRNTIATLHRNGEVVRISRGVYKGNNNHAEK